MTSAAVPALYAGLDLGGTNIAAVFEVAGQRTFQSIPTLGHEGPERVMEGMAAMIRGFAEESGAAVAAVGLGVPGLVEIATGTTLFLPNLPGQWRGVPVGQRLGEALGCPIYVLNDARLAAYGELVAGHGRTREDFALLTLGTGIGGGIVLGGKLRLGPLGAAGELGHQTMDPHGPRCGCGNRGCLEALASATALTAEGVRIALAGHAPKLLELAGGDTGKVSPKLIAMAAQEGEVAAQRAVQQMGRWLGIAAANLITILHCRCIVLTGGMSGMGPLLTDPIRQEIGERVGMMPTGDVEVLVSELGDQAGVTGALALGKDGGLGARTM